MVLLTFVWIFSLVLLVVGVCSVCGTKYHVLGVLLAYVSILFLVVITFIAVPLKMSSGLPKTDIDNGTYKVAFVYVTGENVNVGIEKKDGGKERLYLYQFPKSAFDGKPNQSARQLVVVESGGFRKLVLE